jgi:Na+-transporting NADH:ubiquinone oxidoreductase subunit NqrB
VKRIDPRFYQITVLTALLTFGLTQLQFEIGLIQVAATLAAALTTQVVAARLVGLRDPSLPTAAISGLGLCLLLRTGSPAWAALAAAIAIGSKFALRVRGKHVFNPTNFAIVLLMAATTDVWVSAGQWGSATLFAFFIACLGTVVVTRAARADVTFAHLACHAGLLMARALWLGDPLTIPLHRLENGALLLFAFFMISDPKTTPDSRTGRVIFACLVALGAYYVQNVLYRTNGPLWALAALSPLVPLIDRLLPGPRFAWSERRPLPEASTHETLDLAPAGTRGGLLVH